MKKKKHLKNSSSTSELKRRRKSSYGQSLKRTTNKSGKSAKLLSLTTLKGMVRSLTNKSLKTCELLMRMIISPFVLVILHLSGLVLISSRLQLRYISLGISVWRGEYKAKPEIGGVGVSSFIQKSLKLTCRAETLLMKKLTRP